MTTPVLEEIAACSIGESATLTLDYAARQRCRRRVRLDSGAEVGLNLPRGTVLRDGDCLRGGGMTVRVRAAEESVSIVRAAPQALLRAAYHLGNRHVAVQIADGWIAYLHDHVLDDMLRGLGLGVETALRPFEPEGGAYPGGHAHTDAGHAHPHHHAR